MIALKNFKDRQLAAGLSDYRAECRDWKSFKNTLISLLAKTSEYYYQRFENYKRGNQSPAVSYLELQSLYKKSHGKQFLEENDKKLLLKKFIYANNEDIRRFLLMPGRSQLITHDNVIQIINEYEAACSPPSLNILSTMNSKRMLCHYCQHAYPNTCEGHNFHDCPRKPRMWCRPCKSTEHHHWRCPTKISKN